MQNEVFGDPGPDYGLWWRRVGAQVIDTLILIVPGLVLFFIAVLIATTSDSTLGLLMLIFFGAAWWLLTIFYGPLLMMRGGERNGQTWGKQAMNIRVIRDPEETPYSFAPAFIRQVLVIGLLFGGLGAAFGGIPLLADSLWPLWDKQNRALHDMVVDSRVIRTGRAALSPEQG